MVHQNNGPGRGWYADNRNLLRDDDDSISVMSMADINFEELSEGEMDAAFERMGESESVRDGGESGESGESVDDMEIVIDPFELEASLRENYGDYTEVHISDDEEEGIENEVAAADAPAARSLQLPPSDLVLPSGSTDFLPLMDAINVSALTLLVMNMTTR